jgi:hypothetical protein
MKRRALEKVRRVYNWEYITDQTMNVYNEIVDGCKKSPWDVSGIKEQLDIL